MCEHRACVSMTVLMCGGGGEGECLRVVFSFYLGVCF